MNIMPASEAASKRNLSASVSNIFPYRECQGPLSRHPLTTLTIYINWIWGTLVMCYRHKKDSFWLNDRSERIQNHNLNECWNFFGWILSKVVAVCQKFPQVWRVLSVRLSRPFTSEAQVMEMQRPRCKILLRACNARASLIFCQKGFLSFLKWFWLVFRSRNFLPFNIMPKSCFGPKRPLIQRSFPLIPLIPFGLHSSLMLLLSKSSLQSNSLKSCV